MSLGQLKTGSHHIIKQQILPRLIFPECEEHGAWIRRRKLADRNSITYILCQLTQILTWK
jgi:hypothetical protein